MSIKMKFVHFIEYPLHFTDVKQLYIFFPSLLGTLFVFKECLLYPYDPRLVILYRLAYFLIRFLFRVDSRNSLQSFSFTFWPRFRNRQSCGLVHFWPTVWERIAQVGGKRGIGTSSIKWFQWRRMSSGKKWRIKNEDDGSMVDVIKEEGTLEPTTDSIQLRKQSAMHL